MRTAGNATPIRNSPRAQFPWSCNSPSIPLDPGASERVIRLLVESESRYRPRGAADTRLVVPGDASAGTLMARIRSRDTRIQMPPLGSAHADLEAIALIEHWIEQDLKNHREQKP